MPKHKNAGIQIRLETITPEMAEKLLEKYYEVIKRGVIKNRILRNSDAEKYSRDMKAGKWLLTGDPVRFDEKGNLLDGQHRLWACVDAGVPFKTYVAYGVSHEAFKVIDTGRRRSMGDAIYIETGNSNYNHMAAAIRNLWLYKNGFMHNGNVSATPTNIEGMELTNTAGDEMAKLLEFCMHLRHMGSPSVFACLYYLCTKKNKVAADHFFSSLVDGAGFKTGDPIFVLRESLLRRRGTKERLKANELFAMANRAWNDYRAGKTRVRITRPGGSKDFPATID